MIINCPHCGEKVVVNGLGRKRLNIPFKNVCEALRLYRNVDEATKELGCSVGYIYKVLKEQGMKPNDVIDGRD